MPRFTPLFRPALAALLMGAVLPSAALRAEAVAPPTTNGVNNDPPVGWWRDATFYEIFVRSFADASSGALAGDGIGDFQGLVEHLDYLNDGHGTAGHSLGVNALWLMPIHPSPSYHGYDVTDYFATNPQFGTLEQFKTLVREAHRRGIRIIIDLVLNHCSSEHPLFKQALAGRGAEAAAARAMFRFADVPEQIYGPWGQRAWHPARDTFYYGVFSSEMPDWDFRTPAVTEHHQKVAAFWLRDVGVDGFRLDAVRYFVETGDELQDTAETRRWLREFTEYCHRVKPGSFVVSENTADMREVARYVRGGSGDSSFEFDLWHATAESIRLHCPALLEQTLRKLHELYGPDTPWATLLTNHDQERTLTQFGGDMQSARLAAKVLFTLPGVPFLYYGEELGMEGAKPDPELRTPMPWNASPLNAGFSGPQVKPWHPVAGDVAHANVAAEDGDPASLLNLYRHLVRVNAAAPALRHGTPLPITSADRQVYAAMRATENDIVLVVGNFDAVSRPGPELSLPSSSLGAGWSVREEIDAAAFASPALTPTGGFEHWRPFGELPPKSLYLIHWRRHD